MPKQIIRRDANNIAQELHELHPLLQRIFAARNVSTARDLKRELVNLPPYSSLMNIDQASQRLAEAILQQQKVLVIGDFDADGATSTALAVSALRVFGGQNIDFLVPNRFTFGYGLTPGIVDVARERDPKLIVTVDNGISSIEGVARARELGIDVLITDHHLPGDEIPQDCIIVNPNQAGDTFPGKSLSGVGVIFYVMLALRAYLKDSGWFEKCQRDVPNMAQFLDLVALGTVADVVPLDTINRTLVYQGLQRIRARISRPGILALLQVAGKHASRLVATDLGFVLGPRLNAAGRLEDMSLGINCLLAEDPEQAHLMSIELDRLNHERRAIETQMKHEAFEIVNRLDLEQILPIGVCLFDETWHQGVVGLVASRVKDRVHRPVIAFAPAEEGDILKGSARSVPGVHIRDVLDAVAKKYPELITKFGGHSMAAGLSVATKNFDAFADAFAEEVGRHLSIEQCLGLIQTDGELTDSDLTFEVAELIREAGPWGQDFPEPIFDGVFDIIDQRIVGQRHLRLMLQVPDTTCNIDAIAFNVNLEDWPNEYCGSVKIAYRMDINEYRGTHKLQLLIEDIEQN